MRTAISLILVILTVSFCFFSGRAAVSITEETIDMLADVEDLVLDGNFKEAKNLYNSTYSFWMEKSSVLSLFVHHQLIGDVEASLEKSSVFIDAGRTELFLSENSQTKATLEHIKELHILSYTAFI